ncbi:hypothetical protein MGG_10289 [Pyricularia oryzae 70-15]|uniref:Major facilitator superfamily (MFS) profile domain-containing protein n=1 Tax=Pyricularia oryzae (strain 70-15 / ATCC MYA-4617 / FGSC 8958) TaxID=242507 RepID=G4NK82_PYRO7|nr:uncharacterized protein MGG_10289 [Pyricularia oryzae 70-15]EHA45805.1 hypothetical protein MGG_10289 [Pyricularia oryzae 70-15]KAI7914209.1 hypothetical protein M0657_009608 [Pyricularia oryzae]
MVHPKPSSAAAASTTTTTAPNVASSNRRPPPRMNSGSFHAGAPFPSLNSYSETPMRSPRSHRRLPSSSQGYQTFPTAPPKTPRDAERTFDDLVASEDTASSSSDDEEDHTVTPLPLKQLALLALLSLAEQTALNSISPYLPTMVRNFSEIPESQTGLYVGLVASAFALAQLATNLVWGAMSDRIGRKPVLLLGTALLAGCFSVFGLCTKYWHVVLVQVAMGLLNGNAAVVPTCLGELTDRSNQSSAFTWLPVMYSIGSITGPALGGLLIPDDLSDSSYPFLYPNVVSAALLVFAVVVLSIWYEETLEEYDPNAEFPGLGWVRWLKERIWRGRSARVRNGSWSSRWPTRSHGQVAGDDDSGEDSGVEDPLLSNHTTQDSSAQQTLVGSPRRGSDDSKNHHNTDSQMSVFRQLLNHRTVLVLGTYLVFQLSNISFNSLYPIFASSPGPAGRDMNPETIGLLLSFAGFMTIAFQISIFQPIKARMGNLRSYRYALMGLAISMALMPWAGFTGGDEDQPPFGIGSASNWLYAEMAVVLVMKNICAVGGLSSVMLLITNSAPSHETLGTLNGIAQTLSAAGRSVGPFVSGGIFTLSSQVRPRGELVAWGVFGGIALLGWFGTLAIRGEGLESADWVGEEESDDAEEDTEARL